MKLPTLFAVSLPCALLASVLLALTTGAAAQSFCASDGQPQPTRLLERFINADCDTCWTDPATPNVQPHQIALDWVLPGSLGDNAPLSAVASRDALARLEALGRMIPAQTEVVVSTLKPLGQTEKAIFRVAHGLPVNEYLGASIELKPIPAAAKKQNWTAWLALVETLPAGTEGSPVDRNLVRNLLQTTWDGRFPLLQDEQNRDLDRFFDARSMSLTPGVKPERLRVIGWVENEKRQLVAAAESRCAPP